MHFHIRPKTLRDCAADRMPDAASFFRTPEMQNHMWKADVAPPPPLEVDDDAPVRRDVDSDDVRRVHPDLPEGDADARRAHQARCDADAYERERCTATLVPPPAPSPFPVQ